MDQTETKPKKIDGDFKPKRPWQLFVLSICFLISPFVNLASALYVGGHLHWYNPVYWFDLYCKLSLPEQILMVSDFGVAALLYFQTKRSWLAAIFIVVLTTGFNFISETSTMHSGLQILSVINITATLGILATLYFFRYPYLDQRESVIGGVAKRKTVSIAAFIRDHGPCEIINISKTGCKIVPLKSLQQGTEVTLVFNNAIDVPSEVIHSSEGHGLKFKKISSAAKKQIAEWTTEEDSNVSS